MVKNFIPSCDLCKEEIPFGKHMRRSVSPNGVEVLMVVLQDLDADLELLQDEDGSVVLDTCQDCYTRMAFHHSNLVN